jgi:hypothetical protein
MSGPKEAVWYFAHDPTPTRLADLEHFAAKQDAWLERNGSFLRRYLGNEALTAAMDARHQIDECINMENPDAGFDAYGEAWRLFNELHQQAREKKQQENYDRRQKQLERQQTVTRLLSECKTLWKDAENRALLNRWIERKKLQELAISLENMATGTLEQVQSKIAAWRKRFYQILQDATKASERNALAVQNCIPKLQAAFETLGKLNIDALGDSKLKDRFRLDKERLQQQAENALQEENLPVLVQSIESLKKLAADYGQKVKIAEFRKATEVVRAALSRCGSSVSLRAEPNGTMVLQATGFPFKSVNVKMNPDTDGMKLDVADKHGGHCVKDVQSLQAELVQDGLHLKVTDWGSGKPGSVEQRLANNLSVGGAT